MARPAGRRRAVREASVYDLREEFLARCWDRGISKRRSVLLVSLTSLDCNRLSFV
jgi:hypothetical protein